MAAQHGPCRTAASLLAPVKSTLELMHQRVLNLRTPTRLLVLWCLITIYHSIGNDQAAASPLWDAYGGVGFSGSTFGRQVPGLHLGVRAYEVSLSVFSTGTESDLAETSYQQALAAFRLGSRSNAYLKVQSSLGLSFQRSYRRLHANGTTSEKAEQTDTAWGPGFAIDLCLLTYLCTRIEGHLGWNDASLRQIFSENGVASIGVRI
jgi:hypothetical protein